MIAVVIPTIRPEQYKEFIEAWTPYFALYNLRVYKVEDGDNPTVNGLSVKEVMGEYSDLIHNFNDGVRNLGFAQAYKDEAEIIISLDDDTRPCGDTIGDHLKILNTKQPITWINTVDDIFMRGFPYNKREEAEVVFSHGLWRGVYDFDASTQLTTKLSEPPHRKMPIPKGTLIPVCVMNVAFKRCVLPYYYQAPMFGDINRFADIWAGIEVKMAIDENNWSMVNGYSIVRHDRASNPFDNLIKEAKGLKMNETYGEGEYFKMYQDKIKRWQEFLSKVS